MRRIGRIEANKPQVSGYLVRLKSGRSPVRSRPWPPGKPFLTGVFRLLLRGGIELLLIRCVTRCHKTAERRQLPQPASRGGAGVGAQGEAGVGVPSHSAITASG